MTMACKIINGHCEHLGMNVPASLCKVCTRYPDGPNDGKLIVTNGTLPPLRPMPQWAIDKGEREAEDKHKFSQICKTCEHRITEMCYYIKRPCMVGKTLTECPDGKWQAMTQEEFEVMKSKYI